MHPLEILRRLQGDADALPHERGYIMPDIPMGEPIGILAPGPSREMRMPIEMAAHMAAMGKRPIINDHVRPAHVGVNELAPVGEAQWTEDALRAALGDASIPSNAHWRPIVGNDYVPRRTVPPGSLGHLTAMLSGVSRGEIPMGAPNMAQASGYGTGKDPYGMMREREFVPTPTPQGRSQVADPELFAQYQARIRGNEAARQALVSQRAMERADAEHHRDMGMTPSVSSLLAVLGGAGGGGDLGSMLIENELLGKNAGMDLKKERRIARQGDEGLAIEKRANEIEAHKAGLKAPEPTATPAATTEPSKEERDRRYHEAVMRRRARLNPGLIDKLTDPSWWDPHGDVGRNMMGYRDALRALLGG